MTMQAKDIRVNDTITVGPSTYLVTNVTQARDQVLITAIGDYDPISFVFARTDRVDVQRGIGG